jgi:hypothetical protein
VLETSVDEAQNLSKRAGKNPAESIEQYLREFGKAAQKAGGQLCEDEERN